ncbi:hypothetical protein AVEN_235716-1 [Araneus ventricosus]|uniref:Uncharacterized protein n=1 Tax=Araneus ventricosus TaxID=182803 RepID=A0A4Y2UH11_ARAVE|nr:hypothetical protein AVEN_235716-1 [Araneus ventricosus]
MTPADLACTRAALSQDTGSYHPIFFRFGKHPDNCCACGEPGTSLLYATKCRLTLSYHLRCPEDQHIEAWMKLITNHHLLRNKIIDLLNFITSQEGLLNRNAQNISTIACIVHPTTKLMSSTTPFFSFLLEHSMPETDHQFQCPRPSHMFTIRLTCHQQHHVKVHVIILGRRV